MKPCLKPLLFCFLAFFFCAAASAQTGSYPTVSELKSTILKIGKAIESDFNSLKGKKYEGFALSESFEGTVHLVPNDEPIAGNANGDGLFDRYKLTLLHASSQVQINAGYRRWVSLTNIALADYYTFAESNGTNGKVSKIYYSPANKPIRVTVQMEQMQNDWQVSMEISATGYKDVSTMAYAKRYGQKMQNYYSPVIDKIITLRAGGASFMEELEGVGRIIAAAESADPAKSAPRVQTAADAAPTELCGLFPTMIKDSETQFKNAKGKLLNDTGELKIFEASYKLDGLPFASIREMKNGTTFLFAFLEEYNSKAEAEAGLLEFAKRNTCTNGILLSKRNSRTGDHYLEYIQRQGNGFYIPNAVTQIGEVNGKFFLSLEIYQKNDLFFQSVTVPKSSSAFSAAVLDVLAKAQSEPNFPKKGEYIKRPETTQWTKTFQTDIRIPKAECFISEDLVSSPEFVASFSAGKDAGKDALETLFKECLEQLNLTFGNTGYYYANVYFNDRKDDIAYFPFAQLGFGRTKEVLRVRKNEKLNTVSIIIR